MPHKSHESLRHSCEFLASGEFIVLTNRASGNCKINRISSTFSHQKSDIIILNNLIYTRIREAQRFPVGIQYVTLFFCAIALFCTLIPRPTSFLLRVGNCCIQVAVWPQ